MNNREKEDTKIIAERGGENKSLDLLPAAWDGHRSVRIKVGGQDRGLATTAYSYKLTDPEKVAVAARICALWNLAAVFGWTTYQINKMADAASKEANK